MALRRAVETGHGCGQQSQRLAVAFDAALAGAEQDEFQGVEILGDQVAHIDHRVDAGIGAGHDDPGHEFPGAVGQTLQHAMVVQPLTGKPNLQLLVRHLPQAGEDVLTDDVGAEPGGVLGDGALVELGIVGNQSPDAQAAGVPHLAGGLDADPAPGDPRHLILGQSPHADRLVAFVVQFAVGLVADQPQTVLHTQPAQGHHGFMVVELAGGIVVGNDEKPTGLLTLDDLFYFRKARQRKVAVLIQGARDRHGAAAQTFGERLVVRIGRVDQQQGPLSGTGRPTTAQDHQFHGLTAAVGDLGQQPLRGKPAGGDDVQESSVGLCETTGRAVLDHTFGERTACGAQGAHALLHGRVHGQRDIADGHVHVLDAIGATGKFELRHADDRWLACGEMGGESGFNHHSCSCWDSGSRHRTKFHGCAGFVQVPGEN